MHGSATLFDIQSSRETKKPPVRLRVSTWHFDTIIDHLLAQPGATYGQIAELIGRGQVWVSMVMRSDAFKQHYAERRIVVDAAVKDAVATKLAAVAVGAADLTLKHMQENPQGISFAQKVDTLSQASKALGFGLAPPAASVTVNTGPQAVMLATPEQLQRARDRLRAKQLENAAEGRTGEAGAVSRLTYDSEVPKEANTLVNGAYGSVPAGNHESSAVPPTVGAFASADFEEAVIVGEDQ